MNGTSKSESLCDSTVTDQLLYKESKRLVFADEGHLAETFSLSSVTFVSRYSCMKTFVSHRSVGHWLSNLKRILGLHTKQGEIVF